MLIREAHKKDIPLFIELAKADGYDYKVGISKERYLRAFEEGCKFYIAEENGVSVGYAALQPIFAKGSRLRWLSVHKEHHRKGIGSQLVNKAEHVAQTLGKNKLYLYTHQSNTIAIIFYSQLKFKVTGFFADKYGKGEHAILLRKQL